MAKPKKEKSKGKRLTPSQIAAIHADMSANMGVTALAKKHGVTAGTIYRVRRTHNNSRPLPSILKLEPVPPIGAPNPKKELKALAERMRRIMDTEGIRKITVPLRGDIVMETSEVLA